jgi:lipoprotein Spr
MISLSKFVAGIALAASCIYLCSCTMPVRTGYDRSIGGYKPVPSAASEAATAAPTETAAQAAEKQAATVDDTATQSGKHKNSVDRARSAATQKEAARVAPKPESRGTLESYARQWLGAKYVYGAASKSKTDCSGFVMQVYKGYYNIALDHSSSGMFKDSRGSKVSRGSLKEGDLVFFGSFWKVDHVGIYLNGDRFIHASTSKGVMISPMNDKYWSHKYQGGRRFR